MRQLVPAVRPQISIIIPLFDARFGEADCVGSWVNQDGFAAEDYEIIVISDGASLETENRVRDALRPGDRIERHPPQKVLGLYDAGARAARADLLLFTELHCVAKTDCLKAIATYFATHDMQGACLKSEPGCLTPFALAESIKFEEYFAECSRPDNWRKVQVRGFAVKKRAYFDVGGFEPDTSYFGDFALSAAFDANGIRLGYIPDAAIVHYYSNGLADFVPTVEARAQEECEFRLSHDPDYCHRYFDTPADWLWRETTRPETARRLFWLLARSALRQISNPRRWYGCGPLLAAAARWAPIAACGLRGRTTALRLAIAWMHVEAWAWRNDARALARRYAGNFSRLETFHRLKFITAHIHENDRKHRTGAPDQAMDSIGETDLFGFHQRERHGDRVFRWSAATGMIGFMWRPGSDMFEIEIADVRGHPGSFLIDVYLNGHRLKKNDLFLSRGWIRGKIAPHHVAPQGRQYLVLICNPIRRKEMAPDRRELGFPIIGFRVDGAPSPSN